VATGRHLSERWGVVLASNSLHSSSQGPVVFEACCPLEAPKSGESEGGQAFHQAFHDIVKGRAIDNVCYPLPKGVDLGRQPFDESIGGVDDGGCYPWGECVLSSGR